MAKFLQSNRGGRKLVFNGFGYVQKRDNSETIWWRCESNRSALKCNGYVKTAIDVVDGGDVEEITGHNHAANPSKFQVLTAKKDLKRKANAAEDSKATTSDIVSKVVGNISTTTATSLPLIKSLKKAVQREKAKAREDFGPAPKKICDLVIPDAFKRTHSGEEFLLLDEQFGDDGRIVIFSTKKNREILKASGFWFADGTFKVAPGIFRQLYTVHALVAGEGIPCVYALTTDQTEETYSKIFKALYAQVVDGEIQLAPDGIMVDFELATINAIRNVFGDATDIHGCFFHMSQSVQRKVDENYKTLYRESAEFNEYIGMIRALAFVRPHEVLNYYLQLEDLLRSTDTEISKAALSILHYFGRNYVGIGSDGVAVPARFPRRLWNVVLQTETNTPRTNNPVEAWHNRIKSLVACDHPDVWKFMTAIKQEESFMKGNFAKIAAGQGTSRNPKYDRKEERLETTISLFGTIPWVDYLKAIAVNSRI